MDMNYLVQRKINAQKQYRRKVTITIVMSVLVVLLILGGLIKVIIDDKKDAKDGQEDTKVSEQLTPGIPSASPDNQGAENNGGTTGESESNSTGQNGSTDAEATPVPAETTAPTPTPIPTPAPVAKKKVAIDPGHGGEDLGSTRQGLYEKDANLAIALYLKEELLAAGYDVFMIRDTDRDVENETRPVQAMENNADIYVSIHLNSLQEDNNATRGAETWYADVRNDGSDVLAQYVIDELTKVIDTRNRGIKLSNKLIVLKNPDMMPACLVECGFITSETERAKLFDADYQKNIAKGICNGIKKFLPVEE